MPEKFFRQEELLQYVVYFFQKTGNQRKKIHTTCVSKKVKTCLRRKVLDTVQITQAYLPSQQISGITAKPEQLNTK